MDRLHPPVLENLRQHVRHTTQAIEELDRRGFQVLHWPSPYATDKPIELSLEHEARLTPTSPEAVCWFLASLMACVGQSPDRLLVPSFTCYGELKLERVLRAAGAQSIDQYFDLPGSFEFISKGYTFRKRIRGGSFMTWNSQGDFSALNLELPAVDLQINAMTARLEFNWKDEVVRTLQEASKNSSSHNPVRFAAQIAGMDLRELEPAIENTTVRQKFVGRRTDGELAFALNIDFVHTRNLRDGNEAQFVDVDVSGAHVVDQQEFDALAGLSARLMERYELAFNFTTKASRALQELGR